METLIKQKYKFKINDSVTVIKPTGKEKYTEEHEKYAVDYTTLNKFGFLNKTSVILSIEIFPCSEVLYRVKSNDNFPFNIPESLIRQIYTEKDINRILQETEF